MISSFFKKLYYKEDWNIFEPFPLRGVFPKLDPCKIRSIEAEVTSEEIKDAIFSMDALKAPSLDGLHAMFY